MNTPEIQFLSDACREGELLPGLGSEILRSTWPGMVGGVALDGCRTCRDILDCRRAVHVEVNARTSKPAPDLGLLPTPKPIFVAMLCTKCFDAGILPQLEAGTFRSKAAQAVGLPLWSPPADTDTLPLIPGIDPSVQPDGTVRVTVEIIDGRVVMGGAR